jgi:parallel beta-helix repeat protein
MKSLKSTFFGALAALLLCSNVAAQPASEVKCGMMVTSNLTLTADLNCPSLTDAGAALIVLGSGVQVNLNGHSITGGGKGFGILVPGADNVTILDGEIRGFFLGVMVTLGQNGDRAYSPQLTGLRLTGNYVGAYLQGARFGEISNCEVSQNSFTGIVVFNGTDYTVVSHNLVYANARMGIAVGCEPTAIDPKASSAACDGLHSTENRIEANTVMGNGWMKGTASDGNAGIMIAFGDRNLVRRNLVLANNTTTDGGQLSVTWGIMVSAGADNVVADNSVVANGRGIGVGLHGPAPLVYSTNTVVSGNSTMYNLSSGIFVGDGNTGTVISGNNAAANGYAEKTGLEPQCRNGIRVLGSGASIMNNRAYDNIGYGFNVETKDIRAQFGNRAARNGAANQCSGLACQ